MCLQQLLKVKQLYVLKKFKNFYLIYELMYPSPLMQHIEHTCLDNGLIIGGEQRVGVQTVALHLAVPAGIATNDKDGESAVLAELIQRGAFGLSALEHQHALERLGIRKHVSCGKEFIFVSAVMLASKFDVAFPLIYSIINSPSLPEDDLDACKSLCLQGLDSLNDDPASLATIELNKLHNPSPFNRTGYGERSCIEGVTINGLKKVKAQRFLPGGSILALAGNFHFEDIVQTVSKEVADWTGQVEPVHTNESPERGYGFIQQQTSQVHIGIAADAPNITDEHALHEAIAITAFGGASSSRLFTQVRQERSLCYSVAARYSPAKDRSTVKIHAGTTPERAQETIDVCLEELYKLKNGITQDEFHRTTLRMKSRLVMSGESTSARANAVWSDFYALGRGRTLQERLDQIDAVKLGDVNDWLRQRSFGQMSAVSIGPEQNTIDDALLNDA